MDSTPALQSVPVLTSELLLSAPAAGGPQSPAPRTGPHAQPWGGTLYDGVAQSFGEWLSRGWAWDVYFTGTFRDRSPVRITHLPQASRGRRDQGVRSVSPRPYIGPGFVLGAWRRFVEQVAVWADVEPWWVVAVEPHRYRGARDHHLHAVIGGVERVRREGLWRWWFDRYGQARALPVEDQAATYIGKYISKGGLVQFSRNLNAMRGIRLGALDVEASRGRAAGESGALPLDAGSEHTS
jgi:hypothetical protein